MKGGGFVACIGDRGLYGDDGATFSYLRLRADSNSDFLAAAVARFQKNGGGLSRVGSFRVLDVAPKVKRSRIEIGRLKAGQDFFFDDIIRELGLTEADASWLEDELLTHANYRQIDITGALDDASDWRIFVNK